jgi:uncharacterized protein (UPF0548 family)
VFFLVQPDRERVQMLLNQSADVAPACPDLLDLGQGLIASRMPLGFAHDISLSMVGNGEEAFLRARGALEAWQQFDPGWVRVANPEATVAVGELVAVVARTAGLWSLNLSRITAIVDTAERFGFLYATTAMHVEEGQERFVIEFERSSGRVLYLIEAVSRPRHILARLGWPLARAMQHRFARDSHAGMRRVVNRSIDLGM